MDDLDLYEDLDEFQEQQERKSKELQDVEEKHQQSLKKIQSLEEENKTLKKKIQRIELSFQSLLDTARNEIKRKDAEILRLRKEKDDICFRRKIPNRAKESESTIASQQVVKNPFSRSAATTSTDATNSSQHQVQLKEKEDGAVREEHSRERDRYESHKHRSRDEYHSKRQNSEEGHRHGSSRERRKDEQEERRHKNDRREKFDEHTGRNRDERQHSDRKSGKLDPSSERCDNKRNRYERDHVKDDKSLSSSDYKRGRYDDRNHQKDHREKNYEINHSSSSKSTERKERRISSSERGDGIDRSRPTADQSKKLRVENSHCSFEVVDSVGKPGANETSDKDSKTLSANDNFLASDNNKTPIIYKDKSASPKGVKKSRNISEDNSIQSPSIFQDHKKINASHKELKTHAAANVTREDENSEKIQRISSSRNIKSNELETVDLLDDDNLNEVCVKIAEEIRKQNENESEFEWETSQRNVTQKSPQNISDLLYENLNLAEEQESNNNTKHLEQDISKISLNKDKPQKIRGNPTDLSELLYDNLDEDFEKDISQVTKSTNKPQESAICKNTTKLVDTPRKVALFDALFGPSPSSGSASGSNTPKNIPNETLIVSSQTPATDFTSKTTTPSEYGDRLWIASPSLSGKSNTDATQQSYDTTEFDKCFVKNIHNPINMLYVTDVTAIDLTEDLSVLEVPSLETNVKSKHDLENAINNNECCKAIESNNADEMSRNLLKKSASDVSNIKIPGLDLVNECDKKLSIEDVKSSSDINIPGLDLISEYAEQFLVKSKETEMLKSPSDLSNINIPGLDLITEYTENFPLGCNETEDIVSLGPQNKERDIYTDKRNTSSSANLPVLQKPSEIKTLAVKNSENLEDFLYGIISTTKEQSTAEFSKTPSKISIPKDFKMPLGSKAIEDKVKSPMTPSMKSATKDLDMSQGPESSKDVLSVGKEFPITPSNICISKDADTSQGPESSKNVNGEADITKSPITPSKKAATKDSDSEPHTSQGPESSKNVLSGNEETNVTGSPITPSKKAVTKDSDSMHESKSVPHTSQAPESSKDVLSGNKEINITKSPITSSKMPDSDSIQEFKSNKDVSTIKETNTTTTDSTITPSKIPASKEESKASKDALSVLKDIDPSQNITIPGLDIISSDQNPTIVLADESCQSPIQLSVTPLKQVMTRPALAEVPCLDLTSPDPSLTVPKKATPPRKLAKTSNLDRLQTKDHEILSFKPVFSLTVIEDSTSKTTSSNAVNSRSQESSSVGYASSLTPVISGSPEREAVVVDASVNVPETSTASLKSDVKTQHAKSELADNLSTLNVNSKVKTTKEPQSSDSSHFENAESSSDLVDTPVRTSLLKKVDSMQGKETTKDTVKPMDNMSILPNTSVVEDKALEQQKYQISDFCTKSLMENSSSMGGSSTMPVLTSPLRSATTIPCLDLISPEAVTSPTKLIDCPKTIETKDRPRIKGTTKSSANITMLSDIENISPEMNICSNNTSEEKSIEEIIKNKESVQTTFESPGNSNKDLTMISQINTPIKNFENNAVSSEISPTRQNLSRPRRSFSLPCLDLTSPEPLKLLRNEVLSKKSKEFEETVLEDPNVPDIAELKESNSNNKNAILQQDSTLKNLEPDDVSSSISLPQENSGNNIKPNLDSHKIIDPPPCQNLTSLDVSAETKINHPTAIEPMDLEQSPSKISNTFEDISPMESQDNSNTINPTSEVQIMLSAENAEELDSNVSIVIPHSQTSSSDLKTSSAAQEVIFCTPGDSKTFGNRRSSSEEIDVSPLTPAIDIVKPSYSPKSTISATSPDVKSTPDSLPLENKDNVTNESPEAKETNVRVAASQECGLEIRETSDDVLEESNNINNIEESHDFPVNTEEKSNQITVSQQCGLDIQEATADILEDTNKISKNKNAHALPFTTEVKSNMVESIPIELDDDDVSNTQKTNTVEISGCKENLSSIDVPESKEVLEVVNIVKEKNNTNLEDQRPECDVLELRDNSEEKTKAISKSLKMENEDSEAVKGLTEDDSICGMTGDETSKTSKSPEDQTFEMLNDTSTQNDGTNSKSLKTEKNGEISTKTEKCKYLPLENQIENKQEIKCCGKITTMLSKNNISIEESNSPVECIQTLEEPITTFDKPLKTFEEPVNTCEEPVKPIQPTEGPITTFKEPMKPIEEPAKNEEDMIKVKFSEENYIQGRKEIQIKYSNELQNNEESKNETSEAIPQNEINFKFNLSVDNQTIEKEKEDSPPLSPLKCGHNKAVMHENTTLIEGKNPLESQNDTTIEKLASPDRAQIDSKTKNLDNFNENSQENAQHSDLEELRVSEDTQEYTEYKDELEKSNVATPSGKKENETIISLSISPEQQMEGTNNKNSFGTVETDNPLQFSPVLEMIGTEEIPREDNKEIKLQSISSTPHKSEKNKSMPQTITTKEIQQNVPQDPIPSAVLFVNTNLYSSMITGNIPEFGKTTKLPGLKPKAPPDFQILHHEILRPANDSKHSLTLEPSHRHNEQKECKSKKSLKEHQDFIQHNLKFRNVKAKSLESCPKHVVINPLKTMQQSVNIPKGQQRRIIINTSFDSSTTLKSTSLADCYSTPIILPSISTNCPTPSNFSGIFSKQMHDSNEDSLKNKKKSPKSKEYVLPAASVLCTMDNLENATKATGGGGVVNKKLHWEMLGSKHDNSEVEDDTDADSTDEEKQMDIRRQEEECQPIRPTNDLKCLEISKKSDQEDETLSAESITPSKDLRCLETLKKPGSESEETKSIILPDWNMAAGTGRKTIARRNTIDTVPITQAISYYKHLEESGNFKEKQPKAVIPDGGAVTPPTMSRKRRDKLLHSSSSPIRVRSAESLMDAVLLKAAMIKKKKLPLCLSSKAKLLKKMNSKSFSEKKIKRKKSKSTGNDIDEDQQLGDILSTSLQEKLVLKTNHSENELQQDVPSRKSDSLPPMENIFAEKGQSIEVEKELTHTIFATNKCSPENEDNHTSPDISLAEKKKKIVCKKSRLELKEHLIVTDKLEKQKESYIIAAMSSTNIQEKEAENKRISAMRETFKNTQRFLEENVSPTREISREKEDNQLHENNDNNTFKTPTKKITTTTSGSGGVEEECPPKVEENPNTSIIYDKEHSSDEQNSWAENSEPECNKYLKDEPKVNKQISTHIETAKDAGLVSKPANLESVTALKQAETSFVMSYKIPKLKKGSENACESKCNKKKEISLHDIGIKTRPFKDQLSSFRIPKIKRTAEETTEDKSSWVSESNKTLQTEAKEKNVRESKEMLEESSKIGEKMKTIEKSKAPNEMLAKAGPISSPNLCRQKEILQKTSSKTPSQDRDKKPVLKSRRKSINIAREYSDLEETLNICRTNPSQIQHFLQQKSSNPEASSSNHLQVINTNSDNSLKDVKTTASLKVRRQSVCTQRRIQDFSSDEDVNEVFSIEDKANSYASNKNDPRGGRRKSLNLMKRMREERELEEMEILQAATNKLKEVKDKHNNEEDKSLTKCNLSGKRPANVTESHERENNNKVANDDFSEVSKSEEKLNISDAKLQLKNIEYNYEETSSNHSSSQHSKGAKTIRNRRRSLYVERISCTEPSKSEESEDTKDSSQQVMYKDLKSNESLNNPRRDQPATAEKPIRLRRKSLYVESLTSTDPRIAKEDIEETNSSDVSKLSEESSRKAMGKRRKSVNFESITSAAPSNVKEDIEKTNSSDAGKISEETSRKSMGKRRKSLYVESITSTVPIKAKENIEETYSSDASKISEDTSRKSMGKRRKSLYVESMTSTVPGNAKEDIEETLSSDASRKSIGKRRKSLYVEGITSTAPRTIEENIEETNSRNASKISEEISCKSIGKRRQSLYMDNETLKGSGNLPTNNSKDVLDGNSDTTEPIKQPKTDDNSSKPKKSEEMQDIKDSNEIRYQPAKSEKPSRMRRKSLYVESITSKDSKKTKEDIYQSNSNEAGKTAKESSNQSIGKRRKSVYLEKKSPTETEEVPFGNNPNLLADNKDTEETAHNPPEPIKQIIIRRKSLHVDRESIKSTENEITPTEVKQWTIVNDGRVHEESRETNSSSSLANRKVRRKSVYVENEKSKIEESKTVQNNMKDTHQTKEISKIPEQEPKSTRNPRMGRKSKQTTLKEQEDKLQSQKQTILKEKEDKLQSQKQTTFKEQEDKLKESHKTSNEFIKENKCQKSKPLSTDCAKEYPDQIELNNAGRATKSLRMRSKSLYNEMTNNEIKSRNSPESEPQQSANIISKNPSDSDDSASTENINTIRKLRRKSVNLQRRILDSSSESEAETALPTLPIPTIVPVIQTKEVIAPPVPPASAKEKCSPPRKKRRVIKILGTSYDDPNFGQMKSPALDGTASIITSPSQSPSLSHPIFHTQVRDESQPDINNMTPLSHDDRFKEIDTTMQNMFYSPQHEPATDLRSQLQQKSTNQDSSISSPLNDSQVNLTINETNCSSKGKMQTSEANIANVQETNVSMNTTTTSTTTSSSLNQSDTTKHVTLGSSEYRFEKVSENVVNLFISRKRKRKLTK